MPSFKEQPEPRLSEEHARQYERFAGVPYDPEAIARAKAWAAFNRWHFALKTAAAAGEYAPSSESRVASPERSRRSRSRRTHASARTTMTDNVVILHTGPWERRERMFKYAEERLDAYVARRRARGEEVAVLRPPYRLGQVRAIIEVDGERVRVYFNEQGGWRVA